jgi:hypothetical protein
MAIINALTISYPDFKLNDVIDPDQFDTNNSQIVGKINEIVAQENLNTTAITGKANLAGAAFSGNISAPVITANTTLMVGSRDVGSTIASWDSDWTAWTPTVTGWTAGNATIQAYYKKVGKIVHIEARFQVGSSTTVATLASGDTLVFSLPLQAKRVWGQTGTARIFCGSNVYNGICSIASTNTTVKIFVNKMVSSYSLPTSICVGVPETWNTTTNYVVFSLTYETV